jgi:hypothetical protein
MGVGLEDAVFDYGYPRLEKRFFVSRVDLPFLNRLDLHEGSVVDKSKKCISF